MFRRRSLLALVLLALFLVAPAGNLAQGYFAHPSMTQKIDPSLLKSGSAITRVIVLSQGTPQALTSHMAVSYTLGSNGNFVAFGSVPRSGLSDLASIPQVERVFPDVAINYNDSRIDRAGGGLAQTDMFRIRQIIGVNAVNSTLHLQGDGVKVAIVDTGTDFANPNMATAFARDSNGLPLALDPDGAGIVLTNTTLHTFTNSSGVFLDLRKGGAGTPVAVYLGASSATFPQVVQKLQWGSGFFYFLPNYRIGTDSTHMIVSQSGNYHFGVAFEVTPQGLYFFPTLVVDSKAAGVYDTVYVDFKTAPRFSEYFAFQLLPGDTLADWSFYGQTPHHLGDGTEVLSASLGGTAAPDISAGLLGARVLDVFGAITNSHSGLNFDLGALNGSLLAPMDPSGNYYGVMFDFAGHGSQTASNVASSGSTPYNIYANGTLYHLPGVAPHAKIVPVKALWIGDILYGWMWTSGFDYSASKGTWVYSGNHRADIISNSWGTSVWPLLTSGLGFDIVSLLEDALSLPHSFSANYPGTIFVQAIGNGGPGYGTVTSPASSSFSIAVGASTSWHVASQFSSSGIQYYGGPSSYSGDVISWSDRGPGLTGEVKPDVVNIGAFGFTPRSVMESSGNATNEWAYFGGTSQATPLTAGVAALVVQALESKGTAANPGLVKQILMSTAKDLGNDPFVQGAGQVNASAAVSLASRGSSLLKGAFSVSNDNTYATLSGTLSKAISTLKPMVGKDVTFPSTPVPMESWFAGDITPGGSATSTFTLSNPTSTGVSVGISSTSFKLIGSKTFDAMSKPGDSVYLNLTEKAGKIPAGTALMVVREYFPFASWYNSTISPYYAGDVTRLRLQIYNWVDKDRDGAVQTNEVALVNTNYAWANTEEARVSSPLAKFTGTPELGVYQNNNLTSYWFGTTKLVAHPVHFSITVYYYQKMPWQAVSFGETSVQLAGGSNVTFKATLSVPANATAGTYEGFINLRGSNGQAVQIPVSYVVPVSPALKGVPYTFGGSSSGDGVLYSNGAIYGATDFAWRYESGNWRAYQVQVTDSTVNQGSAKVQWSSPMTSLNLFVLDPEGRIVGTSVPPGLFKSITRNFVGLPLPLPQASPSNDYLGVSFYNSLGWAGGFAPSQNDGLTQSIVEFPINETGTYTIVVHNTVYAGVAPFDRFTGEVELNTIVPISSPPTLVVTPPSMPVRGNFTFPVTVSGQGPMVTTLSIDANPPLVTNGGTGAFRFDTTKYSDGSHWLTVTVTNEVGYVATKSFQVIVLNTPPQVKIQNPTNGTATSGQVGITFSMNSNYISNVSASIDGTPITPTNGYYLWNSAAVPDGTHTLKITVVDQAGNARTVSSQFTTVNQSQANSQATTFRNELIGAAVAGVAVGALVTLAATRMRRRKPSPLYPTP